MYRVLVADDEPIERMIVGRTIKKYFSGQLEVVEAVNGREAAKFFTEKDCKIALLDIEMPVNLVFLLMFCFVLVVLLSLSIAISQLADKCKRLTQANAILEKRVRDLEEKQ